MNPNNCETCEYMALNGNREGWCYMFKDEPTEVCRVHTQPTFIDLMNKFMNSQENLSPALSKILHQNLDSLYEK